MTKHYIAKLDNVTFTRSTANRTYTHMVVGRTNIVQARLDTEADARKYWNNNRGYMQECADGQHPERITPVSGFHESHGMSDPMKYAAYVAEANARSAKHVIDAKEWLAKTEAGLVAEYLARFDERLAKATNVSADGKDFLWDAGWCGRPDLAEALAARTSRSTILEAVEVAKRPSRAKGK